MKSSLLCYIIKVTEHGFKWPNDSEIMIKGERIEIVVPVQTDFFAAV